MAEITDLEVVDADNIARFPEGMLGSEVNDAARALEGILARWFNDTNGSLQTGGSATAYTVTLNGSPGSYVTGLSFTARIHTGNTGQATINVNALGAISLRRPNGDQLVSGDLPAGFPARIFYDGTFFRISNISPEIVGTAKAYHGSTAPSGYVLASGQTIGNASSGATERANADTQTLFELLWGSHTNTELPIQDSSGSASTRGATATNDYTANKRLPLPDLRGRVLVGKDNMGGTGASRVTTAGSSVDGATLGASGGAQNVTLSVDQIPSHDHGGSTNTTGAHTHTVQGLFDDARQSGGGGDFVNTGFGNPIAPVTSSNGNHSHTITAQGGGQAHANMPPALIANWIIKL